MIQPASPGEPRARIDSDGSQITITIRPKRQWFVLLFLPVWLIGWGFGLNTVGSTLWRGLTQGGPVNTFMLVWLAFWTLGGLFAAGTILWMLVGREEIRTRDGVLEIANRLGPLGFGKTYQPREMRRLRAEREDPSGFNYRRRQQSPRALAFDYGAKTVRFGIDIDEPEAVQLADRLRQRLTYMGMPAADPVTPGDRGPTAYRDD